MKKQKIKNLSLILASAIGAAAFTGAVCAVLPASADETTGTTYSVSDVFSTSNATSVGTEVVAFDVKDGGKITLKQRDLALKWYDAKSSVQYMNVELSFADTNFETVTLTLETASATATEEGKTTNKLVFTKSGEKVYAAVNPAKDAAATDGTEIADMTKNLVVTLGEDGVEYGEYGVYIDSVKIGVFTNIGATFGEYASSSATTPLTPFTLQAEMADGAANDAKTQIKIVSINKQSFALNESGKITDTAVPVLVVNDKLKSFAIGTKFALDYEVIDVLDRTVTKSMEYYYYNPTVAKGSEEYKTLTTSTYFNELNYTDGDTETSVYSTLGKELVSIRFRLSDENHKKDSEGASVGKGETTYYLAWYAETEKAPNAQAEDDLDYIKIDMNMESAKYTFLTANETTKTNINTNQTLVDGYQTLVEKAAEDLVAGTSTTYRLPTLRGMIDDDGGYENLKFTIVYKSTSSDKSTKSALSASNLSFSVTKSGDYEFKVFASDKAGNEMSYYLDGKLVKVDANNVWDIEEIPCFSFTIARTGLSIDDEETESDRKDSVTVGSEYNDFKIDLLGDDASSAVASKKLYRIDFDAYNQANSDNLASFADLSKITYGEIIAEAKGRLSEGEADYDEFYKLIYAELLAKKIGGNITAKTLIDAGVFVEINPYNSAIREEDHPNEWERHNKYEWNEESASFKADEEGTYLILAVYTDKKIGSSKVCGYKVVTVASKDDVIPGETEWLKNNIVSVILFSIAGLMLIAIIVIAFIKPSDETLEDVDVAVKAKKSKK